VTVLIADDDRVLVHLLSSRLKARGFNVNVAFDAMQAWMLAMRPPLRRLFSISTCPAVRDLRYSESSKLR